MRISNDPELQKIRATVTGGSQSNRFLVDIFHVMMDLKLSYKDILDLPIPVYLDLSKELGKFHKKFGCPSIPPQDKKRRI